jgi:hypothetical protein
MSQYRTLTPREFVKEVEDFQWTRHIWRIDLHDTPEVGHAAYQGQDSIELLAKLDMTTRGLRTIAQHVSVAPDGAIWTGRDWNAVPASVGLSMSRGAFMLKAIGHFDQGFDRLDGPQLHSVITVIESVQAHFNLPVQALLFPREVPQREKNSPGPTVEKATLLKGLRTRRSECAGKGDARVCS